MNRNDAVRKYRELYRIVFSQHSSLMEDVLCNMGLDADIPQSTFNIYDALPLQDVDRQYISKLNDYILQFRRYMDQACWSEGFSAYLNGTVDDIDEVIDNIRCTERYQRYAEIIKKHHAHFIQPLFSSFYLQIILDYENAQQDYIIRLCKLMYILGWIHAHIFSAVQYLDEDCCDRELAGPEKFRLIERGLKREQQNSENFSRLIDIVSQIYMP